MATHLVKIKLDGDLRIMEIPSPPRFDGLVKAVTEAYSIPAGNETGLTFTYKDSDGDEVSTVRQRERAPTLNVVLSVGEGQLGCVCIFGP